MKTTRRETRISLLGVLFLWLPVVVEAQFTFTTNNGTITITAYTGTNAVVAIPSTTNGYTVTSIGDQAFEFCAGLTSVTIPNSVTKIGGETFGYCTGLTSVTIPNSVTTFDVSAFWQCYSLTNIDVGSGNPDFSSGGGVMFDKAQMTLILCPAGKLGPTYAIPNSVRSIGPNAFVACSNPTSVTIPNSVTNISDFAFYEFYSLTNVTIPDSVTSIGASAFTACTSLTSITIGNGVSSIGYQAFLYCAHLTKVTIPDSITSIGNAAFDECTSLASVTIGRGVTNIADDAFYDCYSLTGTYFLGNAPSADSYSFYGDANMTAYYLRATTGWNTFSVNTGVPVALWLPQVQTSGGSFGVRSNQFGFNINWASGQTVVVEASTNLADPVWSPVSTNTLTTGLSYFSDPSWTNYSGRFYRISSP